MSERDVGHFCFNSTERSFVFRNYSRFACSLCRNPMEGIDVLYGSIEDLNRIQEFVSQYSKVLESKEK